MKRKNLIFNTGKGTEVDDYVVKLAEKNDDPDYWLGFLEHNYNTAKSKKRKDDQIDLDNKENGNNSESHSSSITNTISSVVVPAVAATVIASLGLVPGLESLAGVDLFNKGQNNISANIISIEPTNNNAKYNINFDFDTDIDEKFDLNNENIAVTLTNDFVKCEQIMKYNDTGPSEQEVAVEPKGDSNISSKYTIKQNGEVVNNEEGKTKHSSYNVNGFFEGLKQNMNYTLTVQRQGKVLARQAFKTKSDEDMPPFEIISAEMQTDAYRDIASFEIQIKAKNWNEGVKFNNEECVLRLSGNQGQVDFNIGTDYSYILKQDIELVYDLSHNKQENGDTTFILRGDMSKLAENTNYTMALLSKNNKITENNFETKSVLEGLEVQTDTN